LIVGSVNSVRHVLLYGIYIFYRTAYDAHGRNGNRLTLPPDIEYQT